ncbi:MAG TPA: response regulator [Ignavibacteria bacterium]|nr:response regulator [Ignavibacteria bacterium]
MEKKILIIDDDPDIIEATSILLEAKGYKVISETDPEKGLESAKMNKPDLIILDIMMAEPDDGFFLLNKFKRNNVSSPVIIYSSVSNALGYNFGSNSLIKVAEFIDKPAEPDKLISSIEKILNN